MQEGKNRSRKWIKNGLLLALLALALYNSVYFKPLNEVAKANSELGFDSAAAVRDFMENEVEGLVAMKASNLIAELQEDLETTLTEKGTKLGISPDYYFMVEDHARVVQILEEDVLVDLMEESGKQVRLATDFIFGNAVREASGVFDIGNYQNTMDFNNISIELNNLVRQKVVAPFKQKVRKGDSVYFKGAVKINRAVPQLDQLRVVPVVLKIN